MASICDEKKRLIHPFQTIQNCRITLKTLYIYLGMDFNGVDNVQKSIESETETAKRKSIFTLSLYLFRSLCCALSSFIFAIRLS